MAEMSFRTVVDTKDLGSKIDYNGAVVTIGSCFAEHIAGKFDFYKFDVFSNPVGILFHPLAIYRLMEAAINQKVFGLEDVFEFRELWHCFDVHSECSRANADELIDFLNNQTSLLRQKLEKCTHLFITYGTAWVYEDLETNRVVANCHKLPQNHFRKRLLGYNEIKTIINKTLDLMAFNPSCQIIFTLSPVRHTKDGMVENMRSKSLLLASMHEVLEQRKGNYFPSYEIMMDDLRDYRFYESDMIHPSKVAIEYIWNKLVERYICANQLSLMKEIEQIQRDLAHRPFNPETEAHRKFLEKLNDKITRIKKQLPYVSI